MAIVPQVNPDGITRVSGLPNVRVQARMPDDPLAGLAAVGRDAAALIGRFREQKQEEADTAALLQARKELSDWENGWFDPANENGISKFKGLNALGADEAALPDFDSRVSEIKTRLSPRQKANFDAVAFGVREGVGNRLQSFMLREHEQAVDETRKATLSTLLNDATAAGLRGDETRAQQILAEAIAAQERVDTETGRGADVVKFNRLNITSQYHASILSGLIDTDWAGAEEYLERNRDSMSADIVAKAQGQLRPIAEQARIENDVGAIFDGLPVSIATPGKAPVAVAEIQNTFHGLAAAHGTVVTSMVRPVIKAGAGAASQHPKGTAADFRTRGMSRAQIDKLIADGRRAGFEVIDESDGKTGTGPHVHMELPSARKVATSAGGRPATLGDAIKRARSLYSDPRLQQKAEAEARSRWSVMEADRADGERLALERMRDRVGNGKGSLRARLGSDYAEAQRQGWLPSLEAMIDPGLVKTDPAVYDSFARLLVRDPKAFAKPETITAIWKAQGDLATGDLARLQSAWVSMNTPDKADAKVADWATEAQRIDRGAMLLGYDRLETDEERRAATGVLRLAYQQAERAFIELNAGKKPTPAQADVLLDEVTRRFKDDPNRASKVRAAASYSATGAEWVQAADLLRQRLRRDPTRAEVNAALGRYYAQNRTPIDNAN